MRDHMASSAPDYGVMYQHYPPSYPGKLQLRDTIRQKILVIPLAQIPYDFSSSVCVLFS